MFTEGTLDTLPWQATKVSSGRTHAAVNECEEPSHLNKPRGSLKEF